jgi:pimeloyl-ACP methyl ester carboxylesterase
MEPMAQTELRHRQVDVDGLGIHAVECGAADKPAIVFFHGWPQCWAAFERVMVLLAADTIAAKPGAVPPQARTRYVEAYSRADALRTGFEWYRAFADDEKDNARRQLVSTPVLYLRGEKEQAGIELARYVDGLREAGLQKVGGALIANSGHFAPDEQPDAVAALLRNFLGLPA